MKVVVIGAGMAGLVSATELAAAGAEVTVIDKGRSVGGRLATRRIGDARLDHGAQFFTVRTPAFQRRVDDWLERGVVTVWNYGFGAAGSADTTTDASAAPPGSTIDGFPRYIGAAGMNSLAKDLAVGLDVELSTMVFTVRQPSRDAARRWEVVIDDGTSRDADAVVLTCPLPQSFALLIDSGIELDETVFRTEYDRTIGLLVTLDRPSPIRNGVQDADDVFSFIGDNHAKGISPNPAVTFHASASWSEAHWEDDDASLEALIDAAKPWLGDAIIVDSQLKKWRFATPRSVWPEPCWVGGDESIIIAGDAFAGPRVEGAHNSGLAAAHVLLG